MARDRAARSGIGRRLGRSVERLEEPGRARRRARRRCAGRRRRRPGPRRRARPAPWPCRSGRRGCPRSGPGARAASAAAGGRAAVAVAELASVEVTIRVGRGDRGQAVQRRRGRAAIDAIAGRSSAAERARPPRRRASPGTGGRSPTIRPAWVPPVADGQRRCASSDDPAAAACPKRLEPGEHLPARARATPDPPTPMTYGRRRAPRPSAATALDARLALAAVVGRQLVDRRPERAPSSRTPGPGRVGRRPGQHEVDGQPGPAPAAAVSRQWFDQRRPLVTSVSAPSASAAPTRNSRLRSLLPPNASGSRSSRLIQTSTPAPSAAEKRGSASSGDGVVGTGGNAADRGPERTCAGW